MLGVLTNSYRKLQLNRTLFFSDTSRAKDKTQVQDAYSSAITPLFSCHTVPQFATSWKYVRERVRPAAMKVNQNLHWFKKGIKPMWEDPRNKYGGRLTLCPPRSLLDTVWETVLILMAGDVLDYRGESTGAGTYLHFFCCFNLLFAFGCSCFFLTVS